MKALMHDAHNQLSPLACCRYARVISTPAARRRPACQAYTHAQKLHLHRRPPSMNLAKGFTYALQGAGATCTRTHICGNGGKGNVEDGDGGGGGDGSGKHLHHDQNDATRHQGTPSIHPCTHLHLLHLTTPLAPKLTTGMRPPRLPSPSASGCTQQPKGSADFCTMGASRGKAPIDSCMYAGRHCICSSTSAMATEPPGTDVGASEPGAAPGIIPSCCCCCCCCGGIIMPCCPCIC